MDVITHESNSAQPGEFSKFLKDREAEKKPVAAEEAAATSGSSTTTEVEKQEVAPAKASEAFDDPETGEKIERPGRADKRIKRLWTEREQERARANRLEQELAALRGQSKEAPAAASSTDRAASDASAPDALTAAARTRIRPEPDESEIGKTYPTYEAFVKDCAIWGGELAAEKRTIQAEQQQAETARTEVQTRFGKSVQAARGEYADFDEVTNRTDLPISQEIFDAIVHAPEELAGHVYYYLGAHPEETQRIAALSGGAALVAMGEILGTVRAQRAAKTAGASDSKPRSKAPAPLTPVPRNGGGPVRSEQIAESGGSALDFMRLRNQEVGGRRRL